MLDFIPLPHRVTLTKTAAELDDWGLPVASDETVELRARVSYNTKRETISLATGEQITFTATMLLEGLPDVDYNDTVTWVDGFGKVRKYSPIEIDYKQDMSGNPVAVRVVV